MCEWKPDFEALEGRVDDLEKKVVEMHTVQSHMRDELQQGFTDLKVQIGHIYQEKVEWAKWLRENLPKAGRWLGKWTVILIGVAIGVNNLPTLIQAWTSK